MTIYNALLLACDVFIFGCAIIQYSNVRKTYRFLADAEEKRLRAAAMLGEAEKKLQEAEKKAAKAKALEAVADKVLDDLFEELEEEIALNAELRRQRNASKT